MFILTSHVAATWKTTRDFSSKYVRISAPTMENCSEKLIWMNLPKREELSLRMVFAFPIASMIGFEASTRVSIRGLESETLLRVLEATLAR